MQKVSAENKAVFVDEEVLPASVIREMRLTDLRVDLDRARRQREVVVASGKRDGSTLRRILDIDAWIARDEVELKILEGEVAK